jgi:hypothetical protein
MTRETVLSDTWARSATSLIVGLRNEASWVEYSSRAWDAAAEWQA